MILVTVGTEKFPFNRLMRWIDALIQEGILCPEEKIIVQLGSCTVVPQGTQSHTLLPEEQFKSLLEQARFIIAHCGEGTLNVLMESGRPFVLVPRTHHLGEHLDNHQVELATALANRNIPIAHTFEELSEFIASPWSPSMAVIREYKILMRWGVRCPSELKYRRYSSSTQKKLAISLCQQLHQKFLTQESVPVLLHPATSRRVSTHHSLNYSKLFRHWELFRHWRIGTHHSLNHSKLFRHWKLFRYWRGESFSNKLGNSKSCDAGIHYRNHQTDESKGFDSSVRKNLSTGLYQQLHQKLSTQASTPALLNPETSPQINTDDSLNFSKIFRHWKVFRYWRESGVFNKPGNPRCSNREAHDKRYQVNECK